MDVKVGKGRVILRPAQLGGSRKTSSRQPQRVISMLLSNLGVRQSPPSPKPSLPAGVTYQTLDISGQATPLHRS